MIPAALIIATVTNCGNDRTHQELPITVEQRRASIDSAMSLLDVGRTTEALAITTNLVKKDPASAKSQEAHALVLLAKANQLDSTGKTEDATSKRLEALDAYVIACEESKEPGLLLLSTAQLAQMLNKDTAAAYYRLAHEQVQGDGRASFFLAQIYMLQENWAEAQQWINESLLRDSSEPFALLSSALVEAQLGNFHDAKQLATRGCQILPNDSSLRFIQARVMRLSGSPKIALEILSSLPNEFRDSPLGKEERNLCLNSIGNASQ